MKKLFYKFLNPNKLIGIPLFLIGFILLIYVFSCHLESTPIAYVAYLWSTYSLIIFMVWFIKTCEFSNRYIKENSKLYKFYIKNYNQINKIFIVVSMTLNLMYGIFKFASGLYYKSFWFITFAIYYLSLWEMKLSLLKNVKNENFGKYKSNEYRVLKRTGFIMLLLNIVLSGIIILIITQNQNVVYNGILIYIIAIYDFYLIITAIINIIKHRKSNSPILFANKCINFTVAMISIISLEVAMIYHFGNNETNFKILMTSYTGAVVVIINTILSIIMIIKSNNFFKQ